MRATIDSGPQTAFEVATELIGADNLNPATAAWALQLSLAYLDHLVLAGEAAVEEDSAADVRRWRSVD